MGGTRYSEDRYYDTRLPTVRVRVTIGGPSLVSTWHWRWLQSFRIVVFKIAVFGIQYNTIQYNKRICNTHGRLSKSKMRWGQSPGWGGYVLRVIREVRWVFSQHLKVSNVFDSLITAGNSFQIVGAVKLKKRFTEISCTTRSSAIAGRRESMPRIAEMDVEMTT